MRFDVKILDLGTDPGEGWEPFGVAGGDRIAWRIPVERKPEAWTAPDPLAGVARAAELEATAEAGK